MDLPWSLDAHHDGMPYAWSIAINVAVFIVLYKYRPLWMFAHVILAGGISFVTLLFAFPILVAFKIPEQETPDKMRRHFIFGIVILAIIFLQVLMGLATNILKNFRKSPTLAIYILNKGHKYTGYVLTILAKVQSYLIIQTNGDDPDLFRALISIDAIWLAAFIFIKIWWPSLGQRVMPSYKDLSCQMVMSVKQLRKDEETEPVGVFANYVYDLKNMLKFHPAGYKIVEGIKYRDFDRYLYGMYRTEREKSIPVPVHGYKTLTLVGDPIAKLNIPQLYRNLERDVGKVTIRRITTVSQQGQIYHLELDSAEMHPFQYVGYSDVHQLGRFFSLTLNKKVTRLYTNVGFLDARNVDFMDRIVFGQMGVKVMPARSRVVMGDPSGTTLNLKNKIVLLLKKYDKGQLTKELIEGDHDKMNLQLSCSRGEGLHFGELRPGKIIIVAGGTGIYPFCDLIDLLFKKLLLSTRPDLTNMILENDPILRSNPFNNFIFSINLAVANLDDIHPITLAQLNELSKHPNFLKLMLKISNKKEMHSVLNQNVLFTSQRFSSLLSKTLPTEVYERVWVCGPPSMNEEMVALFDKFSIPPEKYLIM